MINTFREMTITITQVEYEAISFAINQIESEVEAASNKAFIKDANNAQSALYNIMEKYKKARYKASEFQEVRAIVAERNRERCLRPRDIDALARKVLRKIREK